MLSGFLKRRCVNIETGIDNYDLLCSNDLDCPDGDFCGKTNRSPNNGVTNFDNFFYILLAVF